METRTVLHCDLDNFFASVEALYNPALRDVPMAVCGNEQERHGIVLAKNMLAKQRGVKTAQAIWQAKQACPSLVTVAPHYDRYLDFSRRARTIYDRYTDMIEPFGIDECWLDVTGSRMLFGSGIDIARQIRRSIREELGITVSVGVSFNKCFAKLGSDLNKPNGISVITEENFRDVVWALPAKDLLWVGKGTLSRLDSLGIYTVGDIAAAPQSVLINVLGKSGARLWSNARGLDCSPVLRESEQPAAKSIGKSVTGSRDLFNDEEIYRTFMRLSEQVSERLRSCGLLAGAVQIHIRDSLLGITERTRQLTRPTRLACELAQVGFEMFKKNWRWQRNVRSVGIRAGELICESEGIQLFLDYDYEHAAKMERLERSVDTLRSRFGANAVVRASLLG